MNVNRLTVRSTRDADDVDYPFKLESNIFAAQRTVAFYYCRSTYRENKCLYPETTMTKLYELYKPQAQSADIYDWFVQQYSIICFMSSLHARIHVTFVIILHTETLHKEMALLVSPNEI